MLLRALRREGPSSSPEAAWRDGPSEDCRHVIRRGLATEGFRLAYSSADLAPFRVAARRFLPAGLKRVVIAEVAITAGRAQGEATLAAARRELTKARRSVPDLVSQSTAKRQPH